jgi:hypothetical protein
MAAKDPTPSPLVAEGRALLAQLEAKNAERAAAVKPIDDALKTLNEQLAKVNEQLLTLGAGPYADPAGEQPPCRVLAGRAGAISPDTYELPPDGEAEARRLAGEHFKKLFIPETTYTPKNGLENLVELLLTPAKARDLLAFCIIPGKLKGHARPSVSWA